jgi:hypothetical protein
VGRADVYLLKEVFIDAIGLAAGRAEACLDSASYLYPVVPLERRPFKICLRPRMDLGCVRHSNVSGCLGFGGVADALPVVGGDVDLVRVPVDVIREPPLIFRRTTLAYLPDRIGHAGHSLGYPLLSGGET